jgi:alanine racemase
VTNPFLHEALIDEAAISANAAALCSDGDADLFVADVRADGYGHGIVESARAAIAGGATWLGVSCDADVAQLKSAGLGAPAVVIHRGHAKQLGAKGSVLAGALIRGPELYGLTADARVKPTMRVSGRVVGTKTISAGEGVSYGYTYRAPRTTNLALVALGYANGLDRFASNRGSVQLDGKLRMIAGRVAMNVIVLELGEDSTQTGAEAVLFGNPDSDEPAISAWASSLGKPAMDIASVMGSLLPRRYR